MPKVLPVHHTVLCGVGGGGGGGDIVACREASTMSGMLVNQLNAPLLLLLGRRLVMGCNLEFT